MAAFVSLTLAVAPLPAMAGKKSSGGGHSGGGGHSSGGGGRSHMGSGGGSKGGGFGGSGGMHQGGGGMHQQKMGGGDKGGKGNFGKGGSHNGPSGARTGKFSGKSNSGRTVMHSRSGGAPALHSHLNGSFRGRAFHGRSFTAALHNYHRVVHERAWWVTHYNRVVLVSGGWYYWDAGYWYPAWGYDPTVVYDYDGPIYTYDNLPPDEVIINVQTELTYQGYYHGQLDGQMGTATRAAIGDFQREHELEVTSAVDEPTINLLGLI